MPPKSAKLRYYSISRQNSVRFCKDFTPDRICFTPTLLAHLYVFASLPLRTCLPSGVAPKVHKFLVQVHLSWRSPIGELESTGSVKPPLIFTYGPIILFVITAISQRKS